MVGGAGARGCTRGAMARQAAREQGITLRGSAEIVAEFFCKWCSRPAERRAGRGLVAPSALEACVAAGLPAGPGTSQRRAAARVALLAVWGGLGAAEACLGV